MSGRTRSSPLRSIPACAGSPIRHRPACDRQRSIPACAGEPDGGAVRRPSPGVYPRVCGGAIISFTLAALPTVYPPRVRGACSRPGDVDDRSRSIPACAGEPPGRVVQRQLQEVYPRVCGGAPRMKLLRNWPCGLSPRVRGSPRPPKCLAGSARSIPACAGEPPRQSAPGRPTKVYPRVCGGADGHDPTSGYGNGLSPRVRGSLWGFSTGITESRSIPACAGEPDKPREQWLQRWVYPRVCGGASSYTPRAPARSGLSPRVRGSRDLVYSGLNFGRSIPACAGEPNARSSG